MYWYRWKPALTIAVTGGIILSICVIGCKPDIKETSYFDLKGYFQADAARLQRLNPSVSKTVTHNGVSESKRVKIDSWARELDMFISSDINVPALKNSYAITNEGDFTIYRAKYPELKVHEILIKKDKGKVKWILIFNTTKNLLFNKYFFSQTIEKLSYFPDSLYLIQKSQSVRFMGKNYYKIQGVISKN